MRGLTRDEYEFMCLLDKPCTDCKEGGAPGKFVDGTPWAPVLEALKAHGRVSTVMCGMGLWLQHPVSTAEGREARRIYEMMRAKEVA